MLNGADDVTGPRFTLGTDHRRTLHDSAAGLTEVGAAAHEGNGEIVFGDVVERVRWCEHLALVDHIDSESLQHASFLIMPDPGLGHHWDAGGIDDTSDEVGMAHPSDPPVRSDIGGNPLKRHNRGRPSILGDMSLLGSDNVHDDATLLHLGESALEQFGAVPHFSQVYQFGHGHASGYALKNLFRLDPKSGVC